MKIALVIERLDISRGGRETSTAQIAEALVAAGHRVVVLCQNGKMDHAGVEVRTLGSSGWSRTRRLRNFVANVQAAIGRDTFDVVHSMLPLPGANVYQLRGGTVEAQVQASLRRRTLLGRALVRLTRAFNRHRQLMSQLESQVLADPRTAVLAVSEMVAREVEQFYGRRDNVRVVYNAVDVPPVDEEQRAHWRQELRYRMGVRGSDLLLLVVAKNFQLKGVAQTIEAFARWQKGRPSAVARLIIVGRDPAAAEGYVRHASLRGVAPMVSIVPDDREIFRWYSAADVCVLLSWYDPCSRVVLEATRWGVPSITTEFNGAAEIIKRGCGMVVPSPSNRDAVAAAMEAMSDDKRRSEMSQNCLAIAPSLSMKRHVDELIKIYQEVR